LFIATSNDFIVSSFGKPPPISYAEELFNEKHENVPKRLQLFLQLQPEPNAKFYCLLNVLPSHEQKQAALDCYVQENVQEAMKGRLATFYLLSDIVKIILAITCFGLSVSRYNDYLFGDYILSCADISCAYEKNYVGPSLVVLVCGAHFLLREIIQIVASFSSGYFKTWWSDPWNLIDVISVCIMLLYPSLVISEKVNRESSVVSKEIFRSLSTLAAGFLFILVFSFGKRISIVAAVFVRGLLAVATHLLSFLVSFVVIITAFSLMFFTVISGSSNCSPFCTFASSWFEVYNMILGSYGPDDIFGDGTFSESEIYILYVL
jgi:hypothetical protein